MLCHTFSERKVALVMTNLDQASEKTKKNGVSINRIKEGNERARIKFDKSKKFMRVVLQTVKGS